MQLTLTGLLQTEIMSFTFTAALIMMDFNVLVV